MIEDFFAKVALAILFAICSSFLFVHNTQAAEPFIQFGVGETFAIPKYEDGIWYNENLPHQFHTHDLAYKVGLGLKFNPRWSVSLSYLQNSVDSLAVSDACFAVKCVGETPAKFHAIDKVQGAELGVVRTFRAGKFNPYLRGGILLGIHNLHANATSLEGVPLGQVDFSGTFFAPFIGAGVKYKWVFAEVSYYRMIGGFRGDPVSTSFVVPMIGLKHDF